MNKELINKGETEKEIIGIKDNLDEKSEKTEEVLEAEQNFTNIINEAMNILTMEEAVTEVKVQGNIEDDLLCNEIDQNISALESIESAGDEYNTKLYETYLDNREAGKVLTQNLGYSLNGRYSVVGDKLLEGIVEYEDLINHLHQELSEKKQLREQYINQSLIGRNGNF